MRGKGKPRSILIFEQYVQSEKTQEQYLYHLSKFAEYHKLKSIDGILPLKDLKEKIEDYVILFKNNGKSVSYIRLILFAFQSFCEANDLDRAEITGILEGDETQYFNYEKILLGLSPSKDCDKLGVTKRYMITLQKKCRMKEPLKLTQTMGEKIQKFQSSRMQN